MKYKFFIFFIIILFLIFCNKAIIAQADTPNQPNGQSQEFLDEYNAKKYLEEGTKGNFEPINAADAANDDSIYKIIGRAIEMVLSFAGIVLMILIIYSGYLWFSADGNEDQISTAKAHIINAALGLMVIFLAYAITFYVMSKFGTIISKV